MEKILFMSILAVAMFFTVGDGNGMGSEPFATVCLLPQECYELPITQLQRDFYNAIGDKEKYARDPFSNDSCKWNYCSRIPYFNPADERATQEIQTEIPDHPMIQSAFLITCKNLETLNRMLETYKRKEALTIIRTAFEKAKQMRIQEIPSHTQEAKDLKKSYLIEPVNTQKALLAQCLDETGEILFFRIHTVKEIM